MARWTIAAALGVVLVSTMAMKSTEFLLTLDPEPDPLPTAGNVETLERAAADLGSTVIDRYGLPDGREARLWRRDVAARDD